MASPCSSVAGASAPPSHASGEHDAPAAARGRYKRFSPKNVASGLPLKFATAA